MTLRFISFQSIPDFYTNFAFSESLDTRCSSELTISSSGSESVINVTPTNPPENKPKDTEFQISLVPYYGKLINDLFIVSIVDYFVTVTVLLFS